MVAIEWADGQVPVSTRFDDPYYSRADGLAEARHVFVRGNALPERLRDGFHIAELGFGTGLNMLAALLEWRASGADGTLHYTGFEAFPLSAAQIARALAPFEAVRDAADPFIAAWDTGARRFELGGGVRVHVIEGDARQTLPLWDGAADAWFLDGFAPARNPELWDAALLHEVARHTAPGGSFATYTAAGQVRRDLQAAGFEVRRCPGFAHKRHMSMGTLP